MRSLKLSVVQNPLSVVQNPLSVIRGPLSTIFKAFNWMSRIFSAEVFSSLSFLRDSSGDVEQGKVFAGSSLA